MQDFRLGIDINSFALQVSVGLLTGHGKWGNKEVTSHKKEEESIGNQGHLSWETEGPSNKEEPKTLKQE